MNIKKMSKKVGKLIKKNTRSLKRGGHLPFWFFLFSSLLSTLYVEYKFQYAQYTWLGFRVLIMSGVIVWFGLLPKKTIKKGKSLALIALIGFILLYFLNFWAISVNIYHLDRFQEVRDFCQNNSATCQNITDNFYRFKVYRFVSLTSYFFFYIMFLLVGILFTEKISYQATRIFGKIPKQATEIFGEIPKIKIKYAWLFYFLITYLIFQQLILAFSIMSKTTVRIISTLKVPFEERWEPMMGGRFSFGWMAPYGKFINSQVGENETILIPNQVAPWEMEGNPFYIRWFFYPRKTIQMLDDPEIPAEADYILITYGVFGYQKEVYPNFVIDEEKISEIILIDRETLKHKTIKNEGFDPKDFEGKWGIIKLKKSAPNDIKSLLND